MNKKEWEVRLTEDFRKIEQARAAYRLAVYDAEQDIVAATKELGEHEIEKWKSKLDDIKADFKDIGKKIKWYKNKYIYIGAFVVLCGLILHYVFGV